MLLLLSRSHLRSAANSMSFEIDRRNNHHHFCWVLGRCAKIIRPVMNMRNVAELKVKVERLEYGMRSKSVVCVCLDSFTPDHCWRGCKRLRQSTESIFDWSVRENGTSPSSRYENTNPKCTSSSAATENMERMENSKYIEEFFQLQPKVNWLNSRSIRLY